MIDQPNPLHRLYKTELTLLATWSAVVGVVLLVLARWAGSSGPTWLNAVPLDELGSTLFGTGLIVVAWTYIDKKDGDERARQQFRDIIHEEAPAIRDAVVQGFADNAPALANVASPETLDSITRNSLALQLGDRQLAEDVYADLRQQVIRVQERWHDVHVSIDMSDWKAAESGVGAGDAAMFVATVRWEYQVVPTSPTMRFSCVSNPAEYRELLQDPSSTAAWYFPPVDGLDGSSPEAFELAQFSVNGKVRPIRRTKKAGAQIYTVNVGQAAEVTQAAPQAHGKPVTVAYTLRVLVQQHCHLLYLDISKPSKGLKVEFRYGDCGIRYVNVLDFIASAQQTRIMRTPESVPTPAVEVGFDGWIFPKSGVAFVWVLEEEMAARASL